MKKILVLLMAFLLLFGMTACGGTAEAPAEPVTISVSAAASLTDAMNEIAAEYAKESSDIIEFNFGSSGALRTQIEEGAPCDLFISAATNHMDALDAAGLLAADTKTDLLANTLTLIAASEKADAVTLDALTTDAVESIAVGEPETVPAGQYAVQAFESMGITDAVTPKLIYAKDVRAVLDYVDTGNVDCGFVYKTDALLLTTGVMVADVPSDKHDPIVYPAALTANAAQPEAAAAFFEYIGSDTAKAIFEKYGFTVL